jgi:hypothetical protein
VLIIDAILGPSSYDVFSSGVDDMSSRKELLAVGDCANAPLGRHSDAEKFHYHV